MANDVMKTLVRAGKTMKTGRCWPRLMVGGRRMPFYVGEISFDPEIGFIVADDYFHKTRANIKSGSRGSILFITSECKAYQVKGAIEYVTDGPAFEKMLETHDPKHPGVAASVIKVEEVYSGAEKLM